MNGHARHQPPARRTRHGGQAGGGRRGDRAGRRALSAAASARPAASTGAAVWGWGDDSAGHVLAWGSNGQGQLGRGTIGGTHLAAARVAIPDGTRITAVRAGCQFALALTSGGQVLAWGAGTVGQLGDGDTASSGTPVPVSLPPGTTVRAISTGAFHALALTTTGEVLAWGNNFRGELGNGSTTSTDSPGCWPGARTTSGS